MRKDKLLKYSSIVLRIIVAILFLLAGSGKFQTDTTMASNFRNWNLGIAIMFIVAVFEVLGGLFLLIPKTILYGCYMLISVMIGAMVIHFLNVEELGFPFLNIILIAVLSLIIYLKNNHKNSKLTN